MEYSRFERDFVDRTRQVLEQYDELVLGRVAKDQEFEVTLFINCLLGLLVYPKEFAEQAEWDGWLEDTSASSAPPEWGLVVDQIYNPGNRQVKNHKGRFVPEQLAGVDDLSIRNLVRQMRNCVAHSTISILPASPNSDQIEGLEFRGRNPHGLIMRMTVSELVSFSMKLADEYISKYDEEMHKSQLQ